MHDSFMPLSGLVMLVFMQIGEVIFGGVGAGLYGMLLYVVLAVFLAGLMVGRTPEYLGRKIEGREVTLAVLAFLSMPLGILVGGAVAATAPAALSAVQDPGPHGLSEILYAYSSATGNNGSAFGGFGAALPWHTTALGLTMLMGRHAIIVPLLAIAGSMLRNRRRWLPSSLRRSRSIWVICRISPRRGQRRPTTMRRGLTPHISASGAPRHAIWAPCPCICRGTESLSTRRSPSAPDATVRSTASEKTSARRSTSCPHCCA
ncbi:MAG: potassium-transporting ATPase subunit [Cereibacter sp.]|nr:potassium-transporting ATPase subunit [Cereibacter sp.]